MDQNEIIFPENFLGIQEEGYLFDVNCNLSEIVSLTLNEENFCFEG
jgi:hypothetical protein